MGVTWRPMGRKPGVAWRRTVRTSWCPTIMPDKSGYEVCAYVRGADLADLPVLLISGIVNDEVSRQSRDVQG